jgi:RNA polymerase sigma factor (sigma-70 family)
VIPHLRRAALVPDRAGMSDEQLLGCFIDHHDEAAFETLLRKHGPMVLGVCRRLLRNYHDAEDAFQATFLILARKAASLTSRKTVANWLYGVAFRTALKARAIVAQRRVRERQMGEIPEPEANIRTSDCLAPLLEEELSRLPPRYRIPIIVCDLEGKTRKEAAQELGWPEGTVSGRLARGRALLARRLSRRGVTLSVAALPAVLTQNAVAGLSAPLVMSTVNAAALLAAGNAAAKATSAPVAALMEGVLRTMLYTKVKLVAAVLFGVLALCFGVGGLVYHGQAAAPGMHAVVAVSESVEAPRNQNDVIDDQKKDEIVGSGKTATKEFPITGFTTVEVRGPFQVEITRGDAFRTTLTADDNLLEHVKAVKEAAVLKVVLDTGEKHVRLAPNHHLKLAISMPALEGVSLRGACRATVKGFKSDKPFLANVNAASSLNGEISAGKVELKLAGASKVALQGSGREAALSATGASKLLLAEFPTGTVTVQLSGASKAIVQAKDKLDYSLTGASKLEYHGNPTIGKKAVTGASSVTHK